MAALFIIAGGDFMSIPFVHLHVHKTGRVSRFGEGKGENFWCVLFPPLCLLEAEENETDEVEYKSFIKELIDKYF